MDGKITVRHAPNPPMRAERAWRIYRNGLPTDAFVVDFHRDGWIGLTITDYTGDKTFTCQHAGISAGDLARLKAPSLPDSLV